MLKVGITGGIGSGKSVVCRLFSLLGIPVYDSDLRAKWVMQHDPELRAGLGAAFGQEVYSSAGLLNRSYLAGVVFKQPEKLTLLNGLVHPRVREDFLAWTATNARAPYILKEAALMYESQAHKQVNQIITISAPLPIRISRVLKRDLHRTEADVQAIIQKQLPEEERLQRADYIIYNNEAQLVIPQVLAVHEKLLALAPAY